MNYDTSNGTAIAPGDYLPGHASLTIPAGATNGVIRVTVNSDLVDESNETFFVNLSLPFPANAILLRSQGLGTILSSNVPPSVSFLNKSIAVLEGNAGVSQAVFQLCLSSNSEKTVTVGYATPTGQPPAGKITRAQAAWWCFPRASPIRPSRSAYSVTPSSSQMKCSISG